MKNRQLVLVTAAFLLSTLSMAQERKVKPSPPATAETTINGKSVKVDYSSPAMRGRKIMGGLVPYGKVWRTGANEATTLTTTGDITIGGTAVKAGKYTLFTLPSETGWKLIINQQTGQWGTEYDKSKDLAQVDMNVEKLKDAVERFTISFAKKDGKDWMVLQWENTQAAVEIK